MASYVICGGSRLCGDMFVQGSKNAALPILAAALLNDGVTTLENCPDILDVRHMIKIIESVGCLVERKGHQIIIHLSLIHIFAVQGPINITFAVSSVSFIYFAIAAMAVSCAYLNFRLFACTEIC